MNEPTDEEADAIFDDLIKVQPHAQTERVCWTIECGLTRGHFEAVAHRRGFRPVGAGAEQSWIRP